MKNVVILVLTAMLIGAVLWFKPSVVNTASSKNSRQENTQIRKRIILLADMREAGSSCGCAEMIEVARTAEKITGVAFEEYDLQASKEMAHKLNVRVSPTILILNKEGAEEIRFEGEDLEVIESLKTALKNLGDEKL